MSVVYLHRLVGLYLFYLILNAVSMCQQIHAGAGGIKDNRQQIVAKKTTSATTKLGQYG